ncbi:MAG: G-patch domain-containing protein [Benniella sp.]|nr:MAG: G-patch domain-containing protein [Benniella sp.]
MSLKAVRHAKQRLAPDPRNLHWANDTNKFGFKMMEKMGWSQGKGLGAKEDGIQEHVKVQLKENNLGVGATRKTSDNWLGNTDAFSRLLADLNERVEKDTQENGSKGSEDSSSDDDSSNKSDSDDEKEDEKNESLSKKSKDKAKEKKTKKEKKQKKDKKDKEKKEKKEKKDKKSKKEKKDKSDRASKESSKESSDNDDSGKNNNLLAAINGRKASRHKYLKSKHAALQNADRLNEILGIKSETASPATSGTSTPVVGESMTTNDIFATRLQQNNANGDNRVLDDGDEPARPMFGGLGFATSSGIGSSGFNRSGLRGLGFVKATVSAVSNPTEIKVETQVVVEAMEVDKAIQPEISTEKNEESKGIEDKADKKKEKKDKKDKKDKKEKKEKKTKEEEKKDREEEKEDRSSKKDKKRKAEDNSSGSKRSKK